MLLDFSPAECRRRLVEIMTRGQTGDRETQAAIQGLATRCLEMLRARRPQRPAEGKSFKSGA